MVVQPHIQLEPQLTAPLVKKGLSVARMTDYWYVACRSSDLRSKRPLKVTILGIPMVVFRTESGAVGALLDRCPHRNVPLSEGTVVGDCLQCPYHGWEFDTGGACQKIPGLVGDTNLEGRGAVGFPAREQQGFIWVYANEHGEPKTEPFPLPHLDDPRYTHARRRAQADGTLLATIENALDVPHTSYLHKGLFRGTGVRNDITAEVRRWGDRCEAQYIGEPAPRGLAARILAPKGGEVVHYDRFFLPGVAQVDYALGDTTHFCVTSLCTPVSDFHTVLWAVVSFRLRWIPGWLVKLFMEPIGRKIFAQDAKMLALQSANLQQFGGEQFTSTEIDTLGPHIWRLMKAAERGTAEPSAEPLHSKTIRMNV